MTHRIAILGASGYTGAELVRLIATHPSMRIVALSADRKAMWWLVVDGRQPKKSEGVNLYELAEMGRRLGCDDLLNLDGGGSTALLYGGAYKSGPGRLLPNAITFVPR